MRGRGCPHAAPAEAPVLPAQSRAPRRGVGKGVFGLAFPASSAGLGRLAPPAGPVFLPPLSAVADLPRRVCPRGPRRSAAHEPRTWRSPAHRPRPAPSTKGRSPQPRRPLGSSPASLSMWVGSPGLGLGRGLGVLVGEVLVWVKPCKVCDIL